MISAARALAISGRSARMSNVELPIGPASEIRVKATCTSVGVTPGALAVSPSHPVPTDAVPDAAPADAPAGPGPPGLPALDAAPAAPGAPAGGAPPARPPACAPPPR